MLTGLQRRFWVAFTVVACLPANQVLAGSIERGSAIRDLPGVNASGTLMDGMGFDGPVTIKFTANEKTGKYTAHGTGKVTNQSGESHSFTDALSIMLPGPGTTGVHTTYTVKASGHCTLKATATLLPPCKEPADNEQVPAGAEPNPGADIGALVFGRDAIPSQKHCLESVGRLAGSAIGLIDGETTPERK
jgi:hypothetical protein